MEKLRAGFGVFSAVVLYDGMLLHRSVSSGVVQRAFSETTSAFGLPGLQLVQKLGAKSSRPLPAPSALRGWFV
eukprot:6816432-Lingulodinium_polyedra.AAC.1